MEFWLVRHGETSANVERRFQGRLDIPLNTRGRREAALLSRRLSRSASFDLFLSSDLQRAWETAVIISRGIKQAPLSEPLLQECSWGSLEGLRRSEAAAAYPFFFCPTSGRVKALRCGGEGERRLLARTGALRRIIGRRFGKPRRTLLVGHGRLINAFVSGAMGLSSRQRWPYAPDPASLTVLRYNQACGRCRLLLFNDTAHLESLNGPLLSAPL